MAVTKYVSNNLFLQFGALVLAQKDALLKKRIYQEFGVDMTADVEDASAGADEHKSYVVTLIDKTFSFKALLDSVEVANGLVENLEIGMTDVLTWGPTGKSAGAEKGACDAIITKLSRPQTFNKLAMIDISFQGSGEWIFNPSKDKW